MARIYVYISYTYGWEFKWLNRLSFLITIFLEIIWKKHQQYVTYLQHFLCDRLKKDRKCFSPQGAEFYSPLNLFDHSFSILRVMLAQCILRNETRSWKSQHNCPRLCSNWSKYVWPKIELRSWKVKVIPKIFKRENIPCNTWVCASCQYSLEAAALGLLWKMTEVTRLKGRSEFGLSQ